jgi:hypothetical protein
VFFYKDKYIILNFYKYFNKNKMVTKVLSKRFEILRKLKY